MWKWRLIIFVPAASKALAEQAARAINSTGPDYEGDAFTTRLSAGGSEPATHFGLYTSATDAMVESMATALPEIGGASFWRHDIEGSLVASNVTPATGQAFGWSDALAAAGLAEVLPADPVEL